MVDLHIVSLKKFSSDDGFFLRQVIKMVDIPRTDFSDSIGTCEAVTPITQIIVLNLVYVDLELFNAAARGSQKLFPYELVDHVLLSEALCLPNDREVPDCDSFGTSTYQA
jgi:hypothetical protein